MKLVLAGSQHHYEKFIEKMWEKDKPTDHYRYVNRVDMILGLSRYTRVIKLGNFKLHPQHEELLRECEARFDMRPLRERNNDRIRGISSDIYYVDEPRLTVPAGYGQLSSGLQSSGVIRYTGTPPTTQSASITEASMTEAINNMYAQAGVDYGQEEAQEPGWNPNWSEEIRATSPHIPVIQQPTQEQEGLQPQESEEGAFVRAARQQIEREEDRAARWWGDSVAYQRPERGDVMVRTEYHRNSNGVGHHSTWSFDDE